MTPLRYICIHGHFYQPPRENPWLEAIELQDSAYPYHDWNERITAECYAPNGASRILDEEGRIVRIVNNYSLISFNVGPTLMAWMETHAPEVYAMILQADKESRERFSGHGSAMAQAYNHMILPLADPRDRYTQVFWGVQDFQYRFGRRPEGMWLPETGVDVATLETLAELGIKFTVLAPHQARRVRPLAGGEWRDVTGGQIDPSMPYLARLPSGRHIALFFYDGPISQAVAFGGLLENGENFVRRLMDGFSPHRQRPQLVHIATDGETYGHHHRHGDMALAYALHRLEADPSVRLTNYGEYLAEHPPTHEVEIIENTSWSCAHGVERWRSDCGCRVGTRAEWHQRWRGPLREALDWLRDETRFLFEREGGRLLKDPWEARNDYIHVVLNRCRENVEAFFSRHASKSLDQPERVKALQLLEMQRHLMLMYTSCGWFFDEVSGIETVQILQYAGRAIQLAEAALGTAGLEERFLQRLKAVESNLPEVGDGAQLYMMYVKPTVVDLRKVAAHYAISSLFEDYRRRTRIGAFEVERESYRLDEVGRVRLATGRVRVRSAITAKDASYGFAVLHFGDHNLSGGVRAFADEQEAQAAIEAVREAFAASDLPEALRMLDRHFGSPTYSLKSLFKDEQRKIMAVILDSTLSEVEGVYRQVYEHHVPLMRFFNELRMPIPKAFRTAAEYVLNVRLRRACSRDPLDHEKISGLLAEVSRWHVELDGPGLGYALGKTIEAMMDRLRAQPDDLGRLREVLAAVDLVDRLPFEVNLWKVQNVFYSFLSSPYPDMKQRAAAGDEEARRWVADFAALGRKLAVRVE